MFYIRADANKKIATGHVMRCMSIADEMKERGYDVCFITADHNADELIHSRGFANKCLDSEWNNLENELETGKIVSILNNTDNLEGIIVDTYYVTEKYLEILHKICKTIYIDDIYALKEYPVDFLINYNVYASDIDYKSRCLPDTKLLLGVRYVPLRKEFQNIKPVFRKNVKNIFISTGGADKFNMTGELLEEIFEKTNIEKYKIFNEINFHVICGGMNVNLTKLLEISDKHKNVIINKNVSNMAEIMLECEIAVSACGSTMYELCACGLPIITYSFADNQLPGIKKFDKMGMIVNCGDIRKKDLYIIDEIIKQLQHMCYNNVYRKKYVFRVKELVDGKGVANILNELINRGEKR